MKEQYFLVIAGAVAISYGFVSLLRLRKSMNWSAVEGRITESVKRIEYTDAGALENADIAYEYIFAGKKYASKVVKIGGDLLSSPTKRAPSEADLLLAKYPVGRVVDVYVDPRHPKAACLEKAGGETIFVSIFCGSLAVAGGLYFTEIKDFLSQTLSRLGN